MSIDSQAKRESAGNLPWMVILPLPDNAVTADDRIQSAGEYILSTWTSADGHEDPESEWTDEANAYDDDTTTFAIHDTPTLWKQLILTFSTPIRTDKFRIWADGEVGGETHDPDLIVRLYYNGAWHGLWDGEITKGAWYEYPEDNSYFVSKAWIESNDSVYDYLRVYEFQLLDLDNTYTVSARPHVGDSLIKHPLIASGLVR